MSISIRFKALMPALIFGILLAAFLALAHYGVSRSKALTASLAERFEEIEEVRGIETGLTQLIYPHVEYLVTYNPELREQANKLYEELDERVEELSEMAVVNPEEHRFLHEVDQAVHATRATSEKFFALGKDQHHAGMQLLLDLSREQMEPLNESLHAWHDGELLQVEALKEDVSQELDRIILAGIALILAATAVIVFTLWLNNRVLIRPILSISRSASVLASGNLKEQAPVLANDEIGALAKSINSMALSLENLYARLTAMANSDVLTGLFNRRAFEDIAEREVSAARRYGRRLAIVVLDIDQFKLVNDTHGHIVGDAVIQFVAARCKETLRDSDYSFRFGGEEFVLLLHENSSENALNAAERCRSAIARKPCFVDGKEIPVTASFGVACFPRAGGDLPTLMAHADAALYAAKQSGRNRCVSYIAMTAGIQAS